MGAESLQCIRFFCTESHRHVIIGTLRILPTDAAAEPTRDLKRTAARRRHCHIPFDILLSMYCSFALLITVVGSPLELPGSLTTTS